MDKKITRFSKILSGLVFCFGFWFFWFFDIRYLHKHEVSELCIALEAYLFVPKLYEMILILMCGQGYFSNFDPNIALFE